MNIKIDKALLLERVAALCKEKGISPHTAFVESGAGKNFKSNLKTSDPSEKNLNLLAKYFNVTVEYLVGEENDDDLARKVMGTVVEWLLDNDYEVNEDETGSYLISKNRETKYYSPRDFAIESMRIKAISEDGFELAMEDWERRSFEQHIDNNYKSNNVTDSENVINNSPNATLTVKDDDSELTKQEEELIDLYRNFSLEQQVKLLTYAFELREE